MVLKDIISISGESGLFKFLAQGKNSIIVEQIGTGKRSSAFSSARVSSLDDISVFTEDEDMPLGKVFDSIFEKENGGRAVDPKSSPEKLKEYFAGVVPNYAKEKVYVSDIRKIAQWYNILLDNGMLKKEEEKAEADPAEKAEAETAGISAEDNADASTEGKKSKAAGAPAKKAGKTGSPKGKS